MTSDAEFIQLLTPEGERVPDETYDPWVADVTDEHLRSLYRDLVLTRRVDVEATALQRQGELGLWASCLGQEAAQVGSGRAMVTADFAFPTYREHGVALTRGRRPAEPARPVPRREQRRLGPERAQLRALHDRHRQPVPARGWLRDGSADGGRSLRRLRPQQRGHRLLR